MLAAAIGVDPLPAEYEDRCQRWSGTRLLNRTYMNPFTRMAFESSQPMPQSRTFKLWEGVTQKITGVSAVDLPSGSGVQKVGINIAAVEDDRNKMGIRMSDEFDTVEEYYYPKFLERVGLDSRARANYLAFPWVTSKALFQEQRRHDPRLAALYEDTTYRYPEHAVAVTKDSRDAMYLQMLDIRATVNAAHGGAGGAEGEDAAEDHQEPMAAAPVAVAAAAAGAAAAGVSNEPAAPGQPLRRRIEIVKKLPRPGPPAAGAPAAPPPPPAPAVPVAKRQRIENHDNTQTPAPL